MKANKFLTSILAGLASTAALADFSFDAAADLRLRLEAFNDIPYPTEANPVARGGYNNYYRIRPRAWAKASWDKMELNVRLTAEWRAWNAPKHSKSSRYPDEGVFDILNITAKDLLGDGSAIVVGRQELAYPGFLFVDGTPMDGSRTSYFNAVTAYIPFCDELSIDLFGIYNPSEDDLAIGNIHRDLTGYYGAARGFSDAAAGYYLNYKQDNLTLRQYSIWKHEGSWLRKAGGEVTPAEDIYTFGLRMEGSLSNELSGYVDGAWQMSSEDEVERRAYMLSGSLKYTPENCSMKPYVSINALYLSGDDPDTKRNEHFNTLYGRGAWLSDLVIFAYDLDGAGNWRNLLYTYAQAGFMPVEGHKLSASAGWMYAPEADSDTGDNNRGMLYKLIWDFDIYKPEQPGGRGNVNGYIVTELFKPGDYYPVDDLAYFVRAQIVIKY